MTTAGRSSNSIRTRARCTVTSERPDKTGQAFCRIDRWLYDFDGDTLRFCWPNIVGGEYPDAISDRTHGVLTLVRDHGPPPDTKRPSGKRPISHPVLGTLIWDDNLDQWKGQIDLKPGL